MLRSPRRKLYLGVLHVALCVPGRRCLGVERRGTISSAALLTGGLLARRPRAIRPNLQGCMIRAGQRTRRGSIRAGPSLFYGFGEESQLFLAG